MSYSRKRLKTWYQSTFGHVPVDYQRMRSPFSIDYTDLEAVIDYAIQLGSGYSVIKRPELDNYNIIHTCNELRLLRDAKVLYRT